MADNHNAAPSCPPGETKPPLGPTPTKAEVAKFVTALRAEHAATTNKEAFYNKYAHYFNCYAYASGGVGSPYALEGYDKPSKTFAVPGAAAGQPMRLIIAEELDRAVIADGYQRVVPLSASPAERARRNQQAANEIRQGYTLVAAFLDNQGGAQSFHFAMRDDTKHWSQKFGSSTVEHHDFDHHSPIAAPHLGKNSFQRSDMLNGWDYALRFVGYYWRPNAGLNVRGGIVPAVGIEEHGHVRSDVWLDIAGGVCAAKEITGWSLKATSSTNFTLGLQHANGEVSFVSLPKSILVHLDGVYHISLSDPSGPTTQLQISDAGKARQLSLPNSDIKRPTPFR